MRKHVARRGARTKDRDELRHMSYVFQWLCWRSADPEANALKGRRAEAPSMDFLSGLGGLFRRLREALGDELFMQHGNA